MATDSLLTRYGHVSQISLTSLEMLVVLLELRMVSTDRMATKATVLQLLHALRNDFEKAEQYQTDELQECATAILEESHGFADFLEGVIKVVPTDWTENHRTIPSRLRKGTLQTLQQDEDNGLEKITKFFAPLHKKVNSLIFRTESVL